MSKKLLPRGIGPFRIVKNMGNVAYKLELLETLKIHPVFHVSLLKPYRAFGKVQPPPSPIIKEDDELLFEVEQVLIHAIRCCHTRPHKFYLIKCLGYGLEYNFLKLEKNLNLEVLKEYWNTVVHSQEQSTLKKGVKSVNVSNKKAKEISKKKT